MSNPEESSPPRRWVPFLLVLLPAWLVVSGGIAIWYYFRLEEQQAAKREYAFGRMVSEASLADDIHKITAVIGERNPSSETAANALDRMASMIEGALSPANTSLDLRKYPGPDRWPLLIATLPGTRPKEPAIWLATTYDSRPGSPGMEANATGIAATLAAAQALAGSSFSRSIHFAFLPHGYDPDSPVLPTVKRFAELTADAHAILCVEAMAAGSELWLTSRDTDSPLLPLFSGLGVIKEAEVTCLHDDTDLASILFEMDRPAVRIATRAQLAPEEPDNAPVPSTLLAASTGRLTAYLRLLAE